jgi:hypothetical protein
MGQIHRLVVYHALLVNNVQLGLQLPQIVLLVHTEILQEVKLPLIVRLAQWVNIAQLELLIR